MRRPLLVALSLTLPVSGLAQAPSETDLLGTYARGPIAITFEPGGHRITRGGQLVLTGRYQVNADTVTFRDLSGTIACDSTVAGRYLWRRAATELTFSLIEDACQGRRGALPGRAWTRAASGDLALTGVTLIDGTGAQARAGMTIVIAEGRIADVFPDGAKPIPAGAQKRDLPGRYVIPGLIDTHVHLATDPSTTDRRALIEAKLRVALLGGVTSVRDMAGDGRALADLARAAKVGDIVAPAIYYSALFAGPDFFTDPRVQSSSRGEIVGQVPWARAVTGETDWRQAVAEARGTGAQGIKLYAALSPELLEPIAREAHAQGLRVWAHATTGPARPGDAVSAGIDVLSHAPLIARELDSVPPNYRNRYRVDYDKVQVTDSRLDQLLHAMVVKGTIFEPTLFVYFTRDSVTPLARWAAAITRRARELGVAISAGTDEMVDEGDSLPNLHDEMELLVRQAGLSPHEALIAATATAARAIGIDGQVGTVVAGKRADLVVLSADPLADIRNTKAIELVVRSGKVYGER